MGLGRLTNNSITHTDMQKLTTSWLVHSWSTLVHGRATGKQGFTRLTTVRTWGKPPPSPLYYTMCLVMGLAPKCYFVLGLSSGSLAIPTVGTLATLEAHNFVCKPLIEMGFKETF